jgi:hypothetical protein
LTKSLKTPAAAQAALYVQAGEIAKSAPLIPNAPTIAIELGNDTGPTAIGLLRQVELSAEGRIIGVYLEVEDGLCNVLLQSQSGFRIIQGQFADREYARNLRRVRQIVAETDEETEARMEQHASVFPEGLAQALAAASGGRVFGVEVEAEDDEPVSIPVAAKSKMQH